MSIRVTELLDHHRTPAVILFVALAFAVSGAVWRAASPATWATTLHTGLAATDSGLDASFAAAMIAHHQSAIDMARAELRGGRNEQLRRLTQEPRAPRGVFHAGWQRGMGDGARRGLRRGTGRSYLC